MPTIVNSPFSFNSSGAKGFARSKISFVVSLVGSADQFPDCFVPPITVVLDFARGSIYVITGSDGFSGLDLKFIVVILLASPETITVWPLIGNIVGSGTRFKDPSPVAFTKI